MLRSLLTFASLLAPASAPAAHHYALSANFIARSVQRSLPPDVILPSITLLSNPSATQPEPLLELRSTEALDPTRSRILLHCRDASVCLPFYVILSAPAPQFLATNHDSPPRPANTLHAGTHATLFFEDDRTHIRIPVITLEPGSPGKRIRVTSPDRRHTWLGEVVDATTLKGSL